MQREDAPSEEGSETAGQSSGWTRWQVCPLHPSTVPTPDWWPYHQVSQPHVWPWADQILENVGGHMGCRWLLFDYVWFCRDRANSSGVTQYDFSSQRLDSLHLLTMLESHSALTRDSFSGELCLRAVGQLPEVMCKLTQSSQTFGWNWTSKASYPPIFSPMSWWELLLLPLVAQNEDRAMFSVSLLLALR